MLLLIRSASFALYNMYFVQKNKEECKHPLINSKIKTRNGYIQLIMTDKSSSQKRDKEFCSTWFGYNNNLGYYRGNHSVTGRCCLMRRMLTGQGYKHLQTSKMGVADLSAFGLTRSLSVIITWPYRLYSEQ